MAEELRIDPDYVQVSLQLLMRIKKEVLFDVYVKRSKTKYTKLLKKGDEIDMSQIQSYADKGIEYFYVTENDYADYMKYLDILSKKFLGPNADTSSPDTVLVMRELVQSSLREICKSTEITTEQINRAEIVIDTCIKELAENPKGLLKIIKSMSRYEYMYRHSLMTSIFTIMLAKADGITHATTLSNIGLGAFLHDIGVAQISFDPELKEDLTGEERKEMERHPELGKRMVDGVKGIRDEVLFIIMQHHEQPNGHGYPNCIKGESIYKPARIVAIADSFSSLVSKRPFRDSVSPEMAIDIMRKDIGKFDRKLLEKFAIMVLGKSSKSQKAS